MNPKVRERIDLVRDELMTHYPQWGVRNLAVVGSGLENLVCRADSEAFGPVAIRVPWSRWIANANDPLQDAWALQRQEAELAAHMRSHGVPVPEVYHRHTGDGCDLLVSAYVAGDGGPPDPREMGRVAALVHATPAPSISLVAMEGASLATVLARRIRRRMAQVEQRTGKRFPLPEENGLSSLLAWPGADHRTLHMDLRPANFIARQGAVVAVVDWGNALFGDPAVDLARTAEMGHLDEQFLAGYGRTDCFGHVPPEVAALYRLDAAVMLTLVFLAEAPDEGLAQRCLGRVAELYAQVERYF